MPEVPQGILYFPKRLHRLTQVLLKEFFLGLTSRTFLWVSSMKFAKKSTRNFIRDLLQNKNWNFCRVILRIPQEINSVIPPEMSSRIILRFLLGDAPDTPLCSPRRIPLRISTWIPACITSKNVLVIPQGISARNSSRSFSFVSFRNSRTVTSAGILIKVPPKSRQVIITAIPSKITTQISPDIFSGISCGIIVGFISVISSRLFFRIS